MKIVYLDELAVGRATTTLPGSRRFHPRERFVLSDDGSDFFPARVVRFLPSDGTWSVEIDWDDPLPVVWLPSHATGSGPTFVTVAEIDLVKHFDCLQTDGLVIVEGFASPRVGRILHVDGPGDIREIVGQWEETVWDLDPTHPHFEFNVPAFGEFVRLAPTEWQHYASALVGRGVWEVYRHGQIITLRYAREPRNP